LGGQHPGVSRRFWHKLNGGYIMAEVGGCGSRLSTCRAKFQYPFWAAPGVALNSGGLFLVIIVYSNAINPGPFILSGVKIFNPFHIEILQLIC
jgi:hypothetical protein